MTPATNATNDSTVKHPTFIFDLAGIYFDEFGTHCSLNWVRVLVESFVTLKTVKNERFISLISSTHESFVLYNSLFLAVINNEGIDNENTCEIHRIPLFDCFISCSGGRV